MIERSDEKNVQHFTSLHCNTWQHYLLILSALHQSSLVHFPLHGRHRQQLRIADWALTISLWCYWRGVECKPYLTLGIIGWFFLQHQLLALLQPCGNRQAPAKNVVVISSLSGNRSFIVVGERLFTVRSSTLGLACLL